MGLRALLGGRELLLGVAVFGLVMGLGWAGEDRLCESIAEPPEPARLERWLDGRCDQPGCLGAEVIAVTGCRAKVRITQRRLDPYGEEVGVFRVEEGLRFSPLLERWRVHERLAERQVLGLPRGR